MAKTKLNIKAEATRPVFAAVGVTDLAVEKARDYVAEVQTKFAAAQQKIKGIDIDAKSIQAVVVDKVAGIQEDVTDKVAELQADVLSLPSKAQAQVTGAIAEISGTYTDLANRGDNLVKRIRNQAATEDLVKAADVTVAKAKATKTSATKTAKAATAKKQTAVKKSAANTKSNAKATTTSAKKTAAAAAKATVAAAKKIGD